MVERYPDYLLENLLYWRDNLSIDNGWYFLDRELNSADKFFISLGYVTRVQGTRDDNGCRYKISNDGLDQLRKIKNRLFCFLFILAIAYNSLPLACSSIVAHFDFLQQNENIIDKIRYVICTSYLYFDFHVCQYYLEPYMEIKRMSKKLGYVLFVLFYVISPLALLIFFK